MFVGHYAASLALKKFEKRASLGVLFLAVQFVDILFFPFVLLGIERVNIVENFTQSTHFELEYMPYTHSLLASLLWGWRGLRRFQMGNCEEKLGGVGSRVGRFLALAVRFDRSYAGSTPLE